VALQELADELGLSPAYEASFAASSSTVIVPSLFVSAL
jgi:hypothetical protein